MDISISIDAYPVYMYATKFPQSTAGAKRGPSPKDKETDIPLLKLKLFKNEPIFALKYVLC